MLGSVEPEFCFTQISGVVLCQKPTWLLLLESADED